MNVQNFISILKNITDNYNTVYALGMFGQPLTESIITQKANQLPDFYTDSKIEALRALIDKNYFGFDCVCLIKGVLWGWTGNNTDVNGGAVYCSNGVPDLGTGEMIEACNNVSTDFSTIEAGELVYMEGHVGVYIGDGIVVECTPKWTNNVLYSNLGNIEQYKTGNYRVWTSHGKLPYVEYNTINNERSVNSLWRVMMNV